MKELSEITQIEGSLVSIASRLEGIAFLITNFSQHSHGGRDQLAMQGVGHILESMARELQDATEKLEMSNGQLRHSEAV